MYESVITAEIQEDLDKVRMAVLAGNFSEGALQMKKARELYEIETLKKGGDPDEPSLG